MRRVLVDTGPIVALLRSRDRYHAWARRVLDTLEPPLFTCDPVLSEACFLLRDLDGGADAVLELVARGVVRCDFSVDGEVERVRALMRKYRDVPMSLADACLVRMTEVERDSVVVTLDGGFQIYRRNGRQAVPTIAPA